MTHREPSMFCIGLYAGEGSKTTNCVSMANTDPALIAVLLYWLRHAPYRAVADPTRRHSKDAFGCATVLYSCATTHRRLLAMIEAVTSGSNLPG